MSAHTDEPRIELSRLLAEGSRTFFTPESVEETLSKVTATATELIAGAFCADVLVISGKKFRSHAATNDLPVRLDSFQEETGEGPCVTAARGDTVVLCNDLAADPRWPAFSPVAAEAGVQSCLCVALFTGNSRLGALNLFGATVDAFTAEDAEIGVHLATHAAIALYAAKKEEQFSTALASRDLLGQAKGMLMERYDIDALQAFSLLSRLSQDSNTPVIKLAADLIVLGSETRTR